MKDQKESSDISPLPKEELQIYSGGERKHMRKLLEELREKEARVTIELGAYVQTHSGKVIDVDEDVIKLQTKDRVMYISIDHVTYVEVI